MLLNLQHRIPCKKLAESESVMRITAKKFARGAAVLLLFVCYASLLFVWDNGNSPRGLTVSSVAAESPLNPGGLSDRPEASVSPNGHNEDTNELYDVVFQERAPRSVPADVAEEAYENTIDSRPEIDGSDSDTDLGGDFEGRKSSKRLLQTFDYHLKRFKSRTSEEAVVKKAEVPKTRLEDIFISVKSTKKFHKTRLDLILRTWFVLAREQTYFFTDEDDPKYQEKTNGHLINTNCSSSHNRKALCCKMSVEFDIFLKSDKKWFCHFDDDNYVNVPRLVKMLQKFNPSDDWYLGKPSIRAPLEILSRDSTQQKISFWFATGGAGFCLSRSLALKMMPLASGGKFITIGEKIRLPDDVTVGYIVEYLLGKSLTVIEQFHSHLEPMKFVKPNTITEQITFSYSKYGHEMNVIPMDGGIDPRLDPTREINLMVCRLK